MKRFAFQTIRPVVSRKKRSFSAHFGPDDAVPPPRAFPFSKAKRSAATAYRSRKRLSKFDAKHFFDKGTKNRPPSAAQTTAGSCIRVGKGFSFCPLRRVPCQRGWPPLPEHFQFKTRCVSNHTDCRFAKKRVFPLTSGRATHAAPRVPPFQS